MVPEKEQKITTSNEEEEGKTTKAIQLYAEPMPLMRRTAYSLSGGATIAISAAVVGMGEYALLAGAIGAVASAFWSPEMHAVMMAIRGNSTHQHQHTASKFKLPSSEGIAEWLFNKGGYSAASDPIDNHQTHGTHPTGPIVEAERTPKRHLSQVLPTFPEFEDEGELDIAMPPITHGFKPRASMDLSKYSIATEDVDIETKPFQSKHLTEGLFECEEKEVKDPIRRLTVEKIVKRVQYNSYAVYIGRSLTNVGNKAVRIDINNTHLKVIGASQKGKSSMVAALIQIITQTHDVEHVLFALLDMENKTSRLFADIPHMAQVTINGNNIPLHATEKEQVPEYLGYIVQVMDQRYLLKEYEVEQEPILFVYIEEFLALKSWLKLQIASAKGEEAKENARQIYEGFVFNLTELARRGLKARIQLIVCTQMDYMDEDFREALNNISTGLSFCVKPSAANAAGFIRTDLVNRNYEGNKRGTAVVASADAQDLILAPEFNLRQKLKELSLAQAEEDRRSGTPNRRSEEPSILAPMKSAQLKNAEQVPGSWTTPVPLRQRQEEELMPAMLPAKISSSDSYCSHPTINAIASLLMAGKIDVEHFLVMLKKVGPLTVDQILELMNADVIDGDMMMALLDSAVDDNPPETNHDQEIAPRRTLTPMPGKYDRALEAWNSGACSIRKLQDALDLNFNQAREIIDEMHKKGLIDKNSKNIG